MESPFLGKVSSPAHCLSRCQEAVSCAPAPDDLDQGSGPRVSERSSFPSLPDKRSSLALSPQTWPGALWVMWPRKRAQVLKGRIYDPFP